MGALLDEVASLGSRGRYIVGRMCCEKIPHQNMDRCTTPEVLPGLSFGRIPCTTNLGNEVSNNFGQNGIAAL
eukprot:2730589-Amphidinium_carterae.1